MNAPHQGGDTPSVCAHTYQASGNLQKNKLPEV
jgi:hypothetical protein